MSWRDEKLVVDWRKVTKTPEGEEVYELFIGPSTRLPVTCGSL